MKPHRTPERLPGRVLRVRRSPPSGARAASALGLTAILLVPFVATLDAAAQDSGGKAQSAREVQNCIDLKRVDHTETVDEDTILFYMRNGDVFRNDLKNRCPTLEAEDRFMYRVTLSQLCDIDVITVLSDVGFGFMPGPSCGLGKFQPIGKDAAAQLLERNND